MEVHMADKFLIKDAIETNVEREGIMIKGLLEKFSISPKMDICVKYPKIFDNKSAEQQVRLWFEDMAKKGYIEKIIGNPTYYKLNPEWIDYFKGLLEIVEKVIQMKADMKIKSGVKTKNAFKKK